MCPDILVVCSLLYSLNLVEGVSPSRYVLLNTRQWFEISLRVKGHTFCKHRRSLQCRMKGLSSALRCCPALSGGTAALNLSPGRRCFCPSEWPSEPHQSPECPPLNAVFTRLLKTLHSLSRLLCYILAFPSYSHVHTL